MLMFDSFDQLRFAAVVLIGIVSYFVVLFLQRRLFYRSLPCPPHSFFWGHLKLIGEYTQKFPRGSYTHNFLTQIKMDYDLPDIYYLDLWPLGPRFIVCTSPDACAIPTTASAFEIPSIVTEFFRGTVGTSFIEATNGPLWKELHRVLAPGLTPNGVKSYNDSIIDQAVALHCRFKDISKSDQTIDMRYELGIYPYQVIATAFFGETLSSELYKDVKMTAELQFEVNVTNNPLAKRRLRNGLKQLWNRIDVALEGIISARFESLRLRKVIPTKATATSLLDRMLIERVVSGQSLDSDLMKVILENANGFLVAGYGTTTDTSSYIMMLLGAFPEVLEKLREEHNRFFDKDFDKTVDQLRVDPSVIKELKYTTAVINETLRMFPIGMGVRGPPQDMKELKHQGQVYPTDGHIIAIATHTMHYDPRYFSKPKDFNPERFLSAEPAFPRNAFRPFERGLRSCLGQSLAMDEMKVMLVLAARWFDFELRDQQAAEQPLVSFTDLDTKIGRHAFQTWAFTAGPSGPVQMKVHSRR
ncbi:hypothetical protein G7046_g8446 [Stylonectria norvegica]|nr:hypothetical protein G7046_g8446 [Stylonectria norvegica]